MPNMVKHVENPQKTVAITTLMKAMREVPPELRAAKKYKVATVCVLHDVDPKTLFKARRERDKAMANDPASIHPLSLESIPYLDKPPHPVYSAQDLIDYDDRIARARTLPKIEQSNWKHYPEPTPSPPILGFQSWLVEATPTQLWPFSIQADGRPLDMIAATLTDRVTEEFEWLTIREFGVRAADTASAAFARAQAQEIDNAAKSATSAPDPTDTREPRLTGL